MNLRSGYVTGQGILPQQGRPFFEEGCGLIFDRWTALQLAVEQGWGGIQSKDKALDLLDDVFDWFYGRKEHYDDELEEELLAAMLQDFNCECEDGSPRQVAKGLIQLHGELCQGNLSGLEQLRASVKANTQASRQQQMDRDGTMLEGDDSDDEDAAMGEASDMEMGGGEAGPSAQPQPPRGPIIDDDGFETVQHGRRRR